LISWIHIVVVAVQFAVERSGKFISTDTFPSNHLDRSHHCPIHRAAYSGNPPCSV